MKWIYLCAALLFSFGAAAQRDLTPNSRKQAFGKRDLRNLANYGLQLQLGATYLMSKRKNDVHDAESNGAGFRGDFLHDPHGRLGGFAEIGMFHFPKKRSKLSLALKTVLVSYYDWGIGFKYFRGAEDTRTQFRDLNGTAIGDPTVSQYNFDFGHVYARFSLHKNIHFKNKKKRGKSDFFLDNSLGLNVDYRVTLKSDPYTHDYPVVQTVPGASYSSPLHVQLHYGLGFGFRLKRGAYLIPGVRAPLLGYQMTQNAPSNSVNGKSTFGNPSFRWFSSKHWPILIHVKYMFVFQKKSKTSCNGADINDQDRNTQKNR